MDSVVFDLRAVVLPVSRGASTGNPWAAKIFRLIDSESPGAQEVKTEN